MLRHNECLMEGALLPSSPGIVTTGKARELKVKTRENTRQLQQINKKLADQDLIHVFESIKGCGKQRNLSKGSRIHNEIVKEGFLENDLGLTTALISMYSKCGALAEAQDLFDELPMHDVIACSALIAGYAHYGLCKEALLIFDNMIHDGIPPNAYTYGSILKACGSAGLLEKGEMIHSEIEKQDLLAENVVLGTALVDMYGKCGALERAQEVFDGLIIRNVISWNALIAGYAQHGFSNKALNCFTRMQDEGLHPDAFTFACILKVIGHLGLIRNGEEIHACISNFSLLEKDVVLGTAIIDMYAKCGAFPKAQDLFDVLPVHDVVSWNALISGFAQHGLGEEVMNCFEKMQDEGVFPNEVTYACILKACGSLKYFQKGAEIHEKIQRLGLLQKHTMLGNVLIDMYAKCGALSRAQDVFDKLPAQDVVSWTALISGYAQNGFGDEALRYFKKMQDEGLSPNSVTFASILKACCSIRSIRHGDQIAAEIKKQGLLGKDLLLDTSLVDMYAKSGELTKAQEVFDGLTLRNIVTWNTLISGYAQHGFGDEVLQCFNSMRDEGFPPDAVTFSCVLKACCSIGLLQKGEEIHDEIKMRGLLENNVLLGNALVDMYAKFGELAKAQDVFDAMQVRDIVTWTSLITGYALLGQINTVSDLFSELIAQEVIPDVVMFVMLIIACSYTGQVQEGQMYFDIMNMIYSLNPTSEHYTCLVHLYGQSGLFNEAMFVIENVPPSDCLPLWSSLLGSCKDWVNVKIGKIAFDKLLQLDKTFTLAYIGMSNIYAAVGLQEEADKIEHLRKEIEA